MKPPVLPFAMVGLLLGLIGAVVSSHSGRVVDSRAFGKDLSESAYRAYQDKWSLISIGRRARFRLHFPDSLLIKLKSPLSGTHEPGEFLFALKLLNRGHYDKATGHFEWVFAREATPLSDVALLYYGYCKQMGKDYTNAMAAYHRLDRRGGRFPEIYFNMAAICEKRKDVRMAEEYRRRYQETLKARPAP